MSVEPAVFDLTRLAGMVGREASSPWIEVTQEMIARFAEATGDRQWIHLDAERARRESPHGGTIAHGFLTLSLVSRLLRAAVRFETDPRMAINYGLNRARFPSVVPAGARVRGRFTLAQAEPVAGGAMLATWAAVIDRDESEKPCCVVEWMVLYHP